MSNPESDRQQGDNQNAPEGDASESKIVLPESRVSEKSEDSDEKGTEEASEKLPQLLEELLPDEVKKRLPTWAKKEMALAFSFQGMKSGSSLVDLTDKIESSHITQFLSNDDKQDERTFRDSQITKKYTLVYVCIFCGLFIFITIFLVKNNVSIYLDLIKVAIGFAGGFGSGLGYKSRKDRGEKQR